MREIGGHVAPAEHALTFLGRDLGEDLLARRALRRIRRQEHLRHREPPTRREIEPGLRRFGAQESIGKLEQDAGAIPGVGIRAARRAMREPPQDLEAVVDDAARAVALDVGDEPDPAGIAFERGMMETVAAQRGHYNATR